MMNQAPKTSLLLCFAYLSGQSVGLISASSDHLAVEDSMGSRVAVQVGFVSGEGC